MLITFLIQAPKAADTAQRIPAPIMARYAGIAALYGFAVYKLPSRITDRLLAASDKRRYDYKPRRQSRHVVPFRSLL